MTQYSIFCTMSGEDKNNCITKSMTQVQEVSFFARMQKFLGYLQNSPYPTL